MARTKDFDEEDVLDKAIQMFWHKGYNGTSMQDLVEGLGISRSSMYDTYGDKHSLFMAALDRYRKNAWATMTDIIENTPSSKEAIKKLLGLTTSELIKDKQHKGCFLVNAAVEIAPHDKEINTVVCENDKEIENFFFKAIKKGQASGEIPEKHNARALARFIINTVKGIRVGAKSGTDKKMLDDIVGIALSVLD
jgi:TetR/AcrR family transcriptional repressor of nem operon